MLTSVRIHGGRESRSGRSTSSTTTRTFALGTIGNGSRDTKLSVGGGARSATSRPSRRAGAKLWRPGEAPDDRGGGRGRDFSPLGRVSSRGRWASRCRRRRARPTWGRAEVAFSKEMEAPDHRKAGDFRLFDDRALVLHRTQQSEGPSPRAIQEATRRRTPPESHQAGSSLPGETGKEALFVELPPASSDLGSAHEGA